MEKDARSEVGEKWNGKYWPEINIMLAAWLFLGWSHPAYSTTQTAPEDAMTLQNSTLLNPVDGTVANGLITGDSTFAADSGNAIKSNQPAQLKLAQTSDTTSVPAVAGEPDTKAADPAAETTTGVPDDERPFSLQLAPVRVWGNVGYEMRRETIENQSYSLQSLITKINASTFIWQPWFAQVSGGVGLTTSATESTQDGRGSNNFQTGNAALNLLPYSRFPFEAHYDRSDNTLDTGLSTVDSSYHTTRYGLIQRYRTPTGNTQYMASYDHNTWDSTIYSSDQQDLMRLEMTQRLTNQTLQINDDYTKDERPQTSESTTTNNLVIRHSYIPNPTFSVENLGNASQTNYRLVQGENNIRYQQISSSAFWRPVQRPLTVTGSARLFGMESASGGSPSSVQHSANANLGAYYELSRNTRVNSSANVNVTESNGYQTETSNQSAGVTYQSDGYDLGTFRYSGFAGSTFTNRIDPVDNGRHLSLLLGHSLNRSSGLGAGTLGLNLNQTLSSDFDTSMSPIARLAHSGSMTWGHTEGASSTFLRLSASDSRTVDGTQDFFQLLNLQASQNKGLSRNASWSGNLTIQMVRQKTGTPQTATATTPATPDTPVTTVTSSSADLSYRNQRAFGVPRLRFVSELRIYGDTPLPVVSSPQQQETRSWENRLDYSVGLLQLRLSARISEVNNNNSITRQSLLMFSMNRPFGSQ